MAVAGADRVAVPRLAVDAPPGVAIHGVVAGQRDRPIRSAQRPGELAEAAGQAQAGPRGRGEDAPVRGHVVGGQRGGRAQQVGDRAPADGQDVGPEEDQEPAEGRSGEGGGEYVE